MPVFSEVVAEYHWLGVMDDDDIGGIVDYIIADALLKLVEVNPLHLAGEGTLPALQQIMEFLGTLKVIFVSVNNLPFRINAQIIKKRNSAVKHLRHAAALSGGV